MQRPCSTSLASVLEQRFECSICLDIFETPRLMPCGHSFCGPPRNCLKTVLYSKIRECPMCRKEFFLPNIHPDSFPMNYSLIAAIEDYRTKRPKKPAKREDDGIVRCELHGKEMDIFCKGCMMLICKECWADSHDDVSIHLVVPFSKYRKERLEQEMVHCPEPISEMSMESVVDAYKQVASDFEKVDEKIAEIEKKYRETTQIQEEVIRCTTDSSLDNKIEELKNCVYAEQKLAKETSAWVREMRDALDNLDSYLTENSHRSSTIISTFSRVLGVDDHNLPKQRSITVMQNNLSALRMRVSQHVPVGGTKPLLRAVVDDNFNIFCLSWFNVLYVLKVAESGLFLRQPELVRKKKTSLVWKDREDGTLLRDIAVSNNILYGAMVSSDLRWSIIVLDKSNFFCLRKLNTIGAIPQPRAGDSWQMAGNRRLLVVRLMQKNTLYVFEDGKYKLSIKLSLNNPINWFSIVFSHDYLMLQNCLDRKLMLLKWHEYQTSDDLRNRIPIRVAPVIRHDINDSDSPILTICVNSEEYLISRCIQSGERTIRLYNLQLVLSEPPLDNLLDDRTFKAVNNEVLGGYDGKIGLSMLCVINKMTVLCQERFRDNDRYSLYLLNVSDCRAPRQCSQGNLSKSTNAIQSI